MKYFSKSGIITIIVTLMIATALGWHLLPCGCRFPTRVKVSRVKADLRSMGTAIEAYSTEGNRGGYPPLEPLISHCERPELLRQAGGWNLMTLNNKSGGRSLIDASTSHPYEDPFTGRERLLRKGMIDMWPYALYTPSNQTGWMLWSPGPDRKYDITDPAAVYDPAGEVPGEALINLTYDPTNGVESRGDIWRCKQ